MFWMDRSDFSGRTVTGESQKWYLSSLLFILAIPLLQDKRLRWMDQEGPLKASSMEVQFLSGKGLGYFGFLDADH